MKPSGFFVAIAPLNDERNPSENNCPPFSKEACPAQLGEARSDGGFFEFLELKSPTASGPPSLDKEGQ